MVVASVLSVGVAPLFGFVVFVSVFGVVGVVFVISVVDVVDVGVPMHNAAACVGVAVSGRFMMGGGGVVGVVVTAQSSSGE